MGAGLCGGAPSRETEFSAPQKKRRISLTDPIKSPQNSTILSKASFTDAHTDRENIWSVYEKIEQIGDGATGAVYKIREKKSQEIFACKMVDSSSLEKGVLDQEIQLLKLLDHPNVIRLQETWTSPDEKDNIFLVLELAKGTDLFTDLRRRKFYNEDAAAHIFIDALKAVRYIHSMGVVHRDLKLQNFVFEEAYEENDGGGLPPLLKLIDFGFSKMYYEKSEHVTMKEVIGTSYFIAPEVLLERGYTEKCDMWSLGVILYMLTCGEPPFFGKTDAIIVDRVLKGRYDFSHFQWALVSNGLKDLIKKLLVLDPDDRLSAREAFEHPWLQKKAAMLCASPSRKKMKKCFKSMDAFTKMGTFERVALSLVVFHESQDRLHRMEDMFLALDRKGDGTVSKSEFRAVFKEYSGKANMSPDELDAFERDADRLFSAMDEGRTGFVSYSQFLVATVRGHMQLDEAKIRSAFETLDIDGSGLITEDNLKRSKLLMKAFSIEEIENIFRETDSAHAGGISYQRFRDAVQQNPPGFKSTGSLGNVDSL